MKTVNSFADLAKSFGLKAPKQVDAPILLNGKPIVVDQRVDRWGENDCLSLAEAQLLKKFKQR